MDTQSDTVANFAPPAVAGKSQHLVSVLSICNTLLIAVCCPYRTKRQQDRCKLGHLVC